MTLAWSARTLACALFAAELLTACSDGASTGSHANPAQASARADAAATAILGQTLPDLAGTPQSLGQWKGKVLVLNYWATWCPPCREEMPAFSRLHERFAPKGVQFVGISIDSPSKVKQFSEETPVAYPLLISTMDTMQTLADLGNVAQGLPFTVILDREGTLHSTKLGRYDEKSLEKRLQELLTGSGT